MKQQTQPLLEFRDVCKSYDRTQAVAGISAAVARREFVALVGASGSGKSTLLKTVNRLVDPSSGTVLIDGDPVESLPLAALRRRIGYVFQSVGLFPHMSVGENIVIGPRISGQKLTRERIAGTARPGGSGTLHGHAHAERTVRRAAPTDHDRYGAGTGPRAFDCG